MADIFHHFPIRASSRKVFDAVSAPKGLDAWWTESSAGNPRKGAGYELGFGPGYDWKAVVTRCLPGSQFELQLTEAHQDWQGTRVGVELEEGEDVTQVRFHHSGWPQDNEHYRTSCYCWAMYLRLLKRYVEHGEVVPYKDRLNA